jgi:hypothetical protein
MSFITGDPCNNHLQNKEYPDHCYADDCTYIRKGYEATEKTNQSAYFASTSSQVCSAGNTNQSACFASTSRQVCSTETDVIIGDSNADVDFEDDDGAVQKEWDLFGEDNDANTNQSNNESNENIEHLSQEDILMFLENESVVAAQTTSQEVRSHHTPHLNQSFDTDDAAFAFYNQYACICGFSVKKAGNYHAKKQW